MTPVFSFEFLLDHDITPATAKQIPSDRLVDLFAGPAPVDHKPKKVSRRARNSKRVFITPRMQEMMNNALDAIPMLVGISIDKAEKTRCSMRKPSGRLGRKRRDFRDIGKNCNRVGKIGKVLLSMFEEEQKESQAYYDAILRETENYVD